MNHSNTVYRGIKKGCSKVLEGTPGIRDWQICQESGN